MSEKNKSAGESSGDAYAFVRQKMRGERLAAETARAALVDKLMTKSSSASRAGDSKRGDAHVGRTEASCETETETPDVNVEPRVEPKPNRNIAESVNSAVQRAPNLGKRQHTILHYVGLGYDNGCIASEMGGKANAKSIAAELSEIYMKLGLNTLDKSLRRTVAAQVARRLPKDKVVL
jgi:DNA-binding NarL/FixJ family response regulator